MTSPRFSLWNHSLIALAFSLALFTTASAQDIFAKAAADYGAGKFEEARRGFIAIASKAPTANVFYNLGNASFRTGAKGEAVLCYERALKLEPWHPQAEANLKFVREQTGARVLEADWPTRIIGAAPLMTLPWIGVTLAWLGALLLGISVVKRQRFSFGGLFFLLLAAGWCGAWLWWGNELGRIGIVTAERTEARREPGSTATVTDTLNAGSRVRITSQLGDWAYCQLPGGNFAWIADKDVESLAGGRKKTETVRL